MSSKYSNLDEQLVKRIQDEYNASFGNNPNVDTSSPIDITVDNVVTKVFEIMKLDGYNTRSNLQYVGEVPVDRETDPERIKLRIHMTNTFMKHKDFLDYLTNQIHIRLLQKYENGMFMDQIMGQLVVYRNSYYKSSKVVSPNKLATLYAIRGRLDSNNEQHSSSQMHDAIEHMSDEDPHPHNHK